MTLPTPVVRGMLSRTSRGPWSIHQGPEVSADPLLEGSGAPYVTILDGNEEPVATVELRTSVYENPSLIAAAPDLAADLLTARAALLEVDQALRAAGVDLTSPVAAGVRDLVEQRDQARRTAGEVAERARLAGVEAAGHVDKLEELNAQLGELRQVLSRRGPGTDPDTLYRELVGVLMTSRKPAGEEPVTIPPGRSGHYEPLHVGERDS
jgi:hypothetical protein